MSRRSVRVVVAEGDSSRSGLLRFVLEGEGYDVVGEASASADLARELALHRPDVVVMDDGIGATAVAMVHDMVPGAKIILAWPGDVVPIGSDARVDPSAVLRELGPAVERLTGVPCATGLAAGGDSPNRAVGGGVLTLSEMLARRREIASRHPTPIEPAGSPQDTAASGPGAEAPVVPAAGEAAAIVMLPVPTAASAAPVEDVTAGAITGPLTVAELGAAAASTAAAAQVPAAAAAGGGPPRIGWHRRLGTIALGGAAVAGSLVLAMTLSGNRVPVNVVGQSLTPSVSLSPSSSPSTSTVGPSVTPSPPVGDLGGSAVPPGGTNPPGSGSNHNGGGVPPPPPSSPTPPPPVSPTPPPGPPGPPTPTPPPPGPPTPTPPPPSGGGHGQGDGGGHGQGSGGGDGNGNGNGNGNGGGHHGDDGDHHGDHHDDGDHDGDDHGEHHGSHPGDHHHHGSGGDHHPGSGSDHHHGDDGDHDGDHHGDGDHDGDDHGEPQGHGGNDHHSADHPGHHPHPGNH